MKKYLYPLSNLLSVCSIFKWELILQQQNQEKDGQTDRHEASKIRNGLQVDDIASKNGQQQIEQQADKPG